MKDNALRHTRTRKVGPVVVLAPKGNLVGGDETEELRQLLTELAESGDRRVVVNFMDVAFINSIALGVFAQANATYRNRRGRIALCHLDDKVSNIFVVTKLVFLFDHFDTEAKAIEALTAPSVSGAA